MVLMMCRIDSKEKRKQYKYTYRRIKMPLLKWQGVGHREIIIVYLQSTQVISSIKKNRRIEWRTHKLSINLFCGIFIFNVTLFSSAMLNQHWEYLSDNKPVREVRFKYLKKNK